MPLLLNHFQSYLSPIQTRPTRTAPGAGARAFNPTLVQFKLRLSWRFLRRFSPFNPTLVQFKRVSWRSSNRSPSRPFNPTLVQFKLINVSRRFRGFEAFNPTLVQFKLINVSRRFRGFEAFNPTLVQFKPAGLLLDDDRGELSILP